MAGEGQEKVSIIPLSHEGALLMDKRFRTDWERRGGRVGLQFLDSLGEQGFLFWGNAEALDGGESLQEIVKKMKQEAAPDIDLVLWPGIRLTKDCIEPGRMGARTYGVILVVPKESK